MRSHSTIRDMFSRQLFRRSVVTAVACCLVGACTSERADGSRDAPGSERRISTTSWDTLWTIGGGLQDSVLLDPSRIASGQGRVYVFDGGASRVVAFSGRDGSRTWSTGRKGGGPGEFKLVRDLKVNDRGLPMLLDVANSRITTLDSSGIVQHEIPLKRVGYADQFAPLPDGRAVLLTNHPDSALAVVDRTGNLVNRLTIPWSEFAGLHPLVRQGGLASAPNGSWAFGFGLGDGWFGFSGTHSQGGRHRFVEAAAFPQVVTRRDGQSVTTELASYAPCSACSMSIDGMNFYVLFGGRTDHRRAVLDKYDLRTGQYRESMLLPTKATEFSVMDGIVFALVSEPAPALVALRPRSQ
jgi:hypothetical protein